MNERIRLIILSTISYILVLLSIIVILLITRLVFALYLDIGLGQSLICEGWYTVDTRPCRGMFEFIFTNPKNRILIFIVFSNWMIKVIFLAVNFLVFLGIYSLLEKFKKKK